MRGLLTPHLPRLIVWTGAFYLFWAAAGLADSPAPDLTPRCEFFVSSNQADVRRIVDDDPGTVWASEDTGEQYVEIRTPPVPATISILWGGPVRSLTLERNTGAGWEPVLALADPDPMPETFQLAVPARRVRLRSDGALRIAELRVTEGLTGSFFDGHTFRQEEVVTATRTLRASPPLSFGMAGRPVRTLQKRLVELGFDVPDQDAFFLQGTQQALTQFQRLNQLPETGELDPSTMRVLFGCSHISAPPTPHDSPAPRTASAPESTPPKPYDPLAPMPRTASALVQFAYEQVGKGYIFGSSGELCSPWFREQNAKLYPSYADPLLGMAKKWDGQQVFDCVGLVKAFLTQSEGEFLPRWNTNVVGAAKKWMIELDTIDTMPREPGILLLQKEPTKKSFSHMGIYVGNGKCIHARGHAYGVVEETMPQLWTHWARPVWLEFDLPPEDTPPWKPYLAAGDVAMVDTSFNGDLALYDQPSYAKGRRLGVRAPNKSYVVIDGVPEDPKGSFWRRITVRNKRGEPVTGYVFAKNLTLASSVPPAEKQPDKANQ